MLASLAGSSLSTPFRSPDPSDLPQTEWFGIPPARYGRALRFSLLASPWPFLCDLRFFPVLSVFVFRLSRLFCSAVPFLSAVRLFVDVFGGIDGFGLGFFRNVCRGAASRGIGVADPALRVF